METEKRPPIQNILELNIPVLLAESKATKRRLHCIRCADPLPVGKPRKLIVIPSDLYSISKGTYAKWALCEKCSAKLALEATVLDISTPRNPGLYIEWVDFLRATLGVCLNKGHAKSSDLLDCPMCGSVVKADLGHLVLGISYKGLPRHNFGVGEYAWSVIHWSCAETLLKTDSRVSLQYLKIVAKTVRECGGGK